MLLYYGFSHRSVKWWKRVFFHLLDLALVNSYVLYKAVTKSKKTKQLQFRVSVAKSLIEDLERPHHRHHPPELDLPIWLTERVFPEPIPDGKRADCRVCSVRRAGQSHQTGYRCKLCHRPLRLYLCFERYHTLKDYKKILALYHLKSSSHTSLNLSALIHVYTKQSLTISLHSLSWYRDAAPIHCRQLLPTVKRSSVVKRVYEMRQ